MNLSAPFIRRPVATTLLTAGARARRARSRFRLLPGRRRCRRSTSRPSTCRRRCPAPSPETMASAVATPLERQFGRIAGRHRDDLDQLARARRASRCSSTWTATSTAPRATCRRRSTPRAATCPPNLPEQPDLPQGQSRRRADPDPGAHLGHADAGRRCTTRPPRSSQQKLSQVEGVGQVFVGGGSLPAVRVELNPHALEPATASASRTCAPRSPAPTPTGPKGVARRTATAPGRSTPTTSCSSAAEYRPLDRRLPQRRAGAARRRRRGAPTRCEDLRNAGLANGKPAVLVIIFRQPGRQHHRDRRPRARAAAAARRPRSRRAIDARRSRSTAPRTIRASLRDVELTLVDLDRRS